MFQRVSTSPTLLIYSVEVDRSKDVIISSGKTEACSTATPLWRLALELRSREDLPGHYYRRHEQPAACSPDYDSSKATLHGAARIILRRKIARGLTIGGRIIWQHHFLLVRTVSGNDCSGRLRGTEVERLVRNARWDE